MTDPKPPIVASDGEKRIMLRRMTLTQLKRIDSLLEQIGEFGELRLIVEKGSIRFVEIVVSKKL